MNWYAVDVTAEAAAREAVEYALMEAGALGTEERDAAGGGFVDVAGYFETEPQVEAVRAALLEALTIYGLASSDVRALSLREVEGRDWLAEWKRNWKPAEVGRFVVAPPWSEVPEGGGRVVIRVEPGMAFGTGTHETTRLCLAAIEKHFGGGSLLDVGTGTGVLAIAAAKLHPAARVEACDTDPLAVSVAEANARLNGVAERIAFRVGSVEETTASADLVCANLTADVILPLLPALLGATCGRLVLSGVLTTQAEAVCARLVGLGAAGYELTRDGEWVAITV
ncbi:MAG: 50S ribosomal protein L11 methyltransferase [Acidobacteria bacterium]|nr:50S ribosomal protein L11 methyltransferase [Acidobacteriota bacterium]MCA1619887.1 50S ribosomal protein L11 methyltransferase [Acidobacteriota bacterium]